MTLLQRVRLRVKRTISRIRKAWSEPAFWSLDSMRNALWWSSSGGDRETIEHDFAGYIEGAYKRSGVVFSCIRARQMVFSQARFQWRDRQRKLFGSAELSILEKPWPGGTTGDLLARMEVDASLAGNAYVTIVDDDGNYGPTAKGPGRRIVFLRPDWVTLVISSKSGNPNALDARVVGFLYRPPGGPELLLLPAQVCHYAPIPDPSARWRGMSWLTPVLEDIGADRAATKHKRKFFENGAALNTVVTLDKDVEPEAFNFFVASFNEQHRGVENAYEPLFLGGGADAKIVQADMKQLDFKATTGVGETRIAAAAGAHPVVVGLSEGLQGAALNAGNFSQVRRLFVDGTIRWLWQNVAASLQTLVAPTRGDVELWYDDRDIAFLRVDRDEVAKIQQTQATAIRTYVDAGYFPDAAVQAVLADDISLLIGKHSGLFSVQLLPPTPEQATPPEPTPEPTPGEPSGAPAQEE